MLKYGGVTAGIFGSISLVYSMLESENISNYNVKNCI